MADKENYKNMSKVECGCERVKGIIAKGGRDSVIFFFPFYLMVNPGAYFI